MHETLFVMQFIKNKNTIFHIAIVALIFFSYRIGLCGFDNPMRDAKTEEVKKHIGQVSSRIFISFR